MILSRKLLAKTPKVIRLIMNIKINHDSKCWEWIGHKDSDGYGSITFKYKTIKSHRESYKIFNGEIPKNLSVLHRCDNPSCINPDHLFLGNQSDNHKDMVSKKRHGFGERNGMSKLTTAQARKVKNMLKFGFKATEISKKLNLTYSSVQKICKGIRWKHI